MHHRSSIPGNPAGIGPVTPPACVFDRLNLLIRWTDFAPEVTTATRG